MGEIRKINTRDNPEELALEPIKMPDWVEKALKIGLVAAAAALAEGLTKWATDNK